MEGVQKTAGRRELESRVQVAEAEVNSIICELGAMLDGGAKALIYEQLKIRLRMRGDLPAPRLQKHEDEYERLNNNPLIIQYNEANSRLFEARQRYKSAVKALEELDSVLTIAEAPLVPQ